MLKTKDWVYAGIKWLSFAQQPLHKHCTGKELNEMQGTESHETGNQWWCDSSQWLKSHLETILQWLVSSQVFHRMTRVAESQRMAGVRVTFTKSANLFWTQAVCSFAHKEMSFLRQCSALSVFPGGFLVDFQDEGFHLTLRQSWDFVYHSRGQHHILPWTRYRSLVDYLHIVIVAGGLIFLFFLGKWWTKR